MSIVMPHALNVMYR